ncbi:hypothetical protein MNBD_ALPHA02-79 [hydrothermal vent metagenome]|uniref:Uncharacterized protein n=1 Tax=hydrothermal vent metagenome TaxID=652676 RepID=A0A3B0R6K9_9ZZZZ
MYNQNNRPARTQFNHYLRTGRILPTEHFEEHKSLKGLSLEQIILGISKGIREPGRKLLFHYFRRRGQTFDLVANGLLRYIIGARVFREARDRFLGDIKRDLMREADRFCDRSQADYIMDRAEPVKLFQKKFFDQRAIDFTSSFFSLGNSFIAMDVTANVEVNCITKGITISGNISYEINDWFRDVTDIEDKISGNQELPFGTAFKMVARWSDAFDLSGRFG